MYCYFIWIFFMILKCFVTSLPVQDRYDLSVIGLDQGPKNASPDLPNYEDTSDSANKQIISVRITSSVAVGRGKDKVPYRAPYHKYEFDKVPSTAAETTTFNVREQQTTLDLTSDQPLNLFGANIEYIKQINAKKETKNNNAEAVHPYQFLAVNQNSKISNDYDENFHDIPRARKIPSAANVNHFYEHKDNSGYQHTNTKVPIDNYFNQNINLTTDAFIESSKNFGRSMNYDANENIANETVTDITDQYSNVKNIRDISDFVSGSNNYQGDDSVAESSIKSEEFSQTTVTIAPPDRYLPSSPSRRVANEQDNQKLTTVSFNIVHDATKTSNNNEHSTSYIPTSPVVTKEKELYHSNIYSQPAQIYSQPSKFYSEPAKVYSEPAKIYSEPAKVYSEPAKVYSEPAKFYSEPASLHLNQNVPNIEPSVPPNYSTWQRPSYRPISSSTQNTTPISITTSHTQVEHQPEKNYEIDEKISILTDGRSHGVQESNTEKCKQDNCKVGYVVEGRQYKKYRVEERTADGFIVGEYGVVRNEDGALRGVRYTADSDASPRLIHDALMKFLQLK